MTELTVVALRTSCPTLRVASGSVSDTRPCEQRVSDTRDSLRWASGTNGMKLSPPYA